MRKRIPETEAYNSWLIHGALFGTGFVALAFVVIFFNVNEQSRRSAALNTELVRVCDLVKEFAANSNRFPISLDEVNFEFGKFAVEYFPRETSASIFLEDPGVAWDHCFIHATPELQPRNDQLFYEFLSTAPSDESRFEILCFPWNGCIFVPGGPLTLPPEAHSE